MSPKVKVTETSVKNNEVKKTAPEKTKNETLVVTIEYRLNNEIAKDIPRDFLESGKAFTAHASMLASDIRRNLPNTEVTGACPVQVATGFEVAIEITQALSLESTIPTHTSRLFENVYGVIQDIGFASEALKVGHDVSKLFKSGELTEIQRILPAKSTQKEVAKSDNNGTIFVTNINLRTLVKRYRKGLQLVGMVNTCGYDIIIKVGKKSVSLTHLDVNSTKADFIVTDYLTWKPLISGHLPEHRIVEVFHDEEYLMFTVPPNNAELYIQAMSDKKAVEMTVEVSCPSNPFLSDEPKFRIAETIKITEPSGQDVLKLSDSKKEAHK